MDDPPQQRHGEVEPHSLSFPRAVARLQQLARQFLLITTIVVGIICGMVAVLFHDLIEICTSALIETALLAPLPLRWILVLVIPSATAFLLAVIINRFAPGAGGANLARVRLAYHREPGLLNKRSVLATFLLTPLSLGSGAPLGPEGPVVVVASGLSTGIARLLRLPRKIVRGMIPVGTAAGIAAIFNTPITGVVFALEEILGTAQRGLLGGAIVASVAAAVVQKYFLGGGALLETSGATWTDLRELIGFAIVGVIAGAVSGTSIRLIRRLRKLLAEILPYWPARVAVAGALVGLAGLVSPEVFGVGYENMNAWLGGSGTLQSTSLAFGTKTIAVIIAVSAGMIGGTFAPSLFMGASLGAAVGHGAAMLLPATAIQPDAYALVGMGAFFAGFLRNPIASVLIVIELTRDYELILPLMLAIALSIAISRRISRLNLVEHQMREEGFLEGEGRQTDPTALLPVSQVMTADPVAVRPDMTLAEVIEMVAGRRHHFYPIVDDRGRLGGVLLGSTIASAAQRGSLHETVATFVEQPEYVARSDQQVREVLREMANLHARRCPVVSPDGSERLVGVLTPTDLLAARLKRVEPAGDARFSEFD